MANGLPEGITLQMRLLDPSYEKDGLLYVDPSDLEWSDASEGFVVSDSSQCGHSETCCDECVDSWRCDREFRLVSESGAESEWFGSVL